MRCTSSSRHRSYVLLTPARLRMSNNSRLRKHLLRAWCGRFALDVKSGARRMRMGRADVPTGTARPQMLRSVCSTHLKRFIGWGAKRTLASKAALIFSDRRSGRPTGSIHFGDGQFNKVNTEGTVRRWRGEWAQLFRYVPAAAWRPVHFAGNCDLRHARSPSACR